MSRVELKGRIGGVSGSFRPTGWGRRYEGRPMQWHRPRFRVSSLVIAAAIPAVLLWGWEMARRAWHYRDLAAMQARLEAAHRDEERRWLDRVAAGAGYGEKCPI